MADNKTISIDTVYQRVLALANKEQRGYITPQEFNLHANQAQLDIFEQYFYDLAAKSALNRREDQNQPGTNVELAPDFGDTVNIIREKLSIYKGTDVALDVDAPNKCYKLPDLTASTIYRTGRLYYSGTDGSSIPLKLIEQTDVRPLVDMYSARNNSRWHIADPANFYYTENLDGSFSLYSEASTTPITSASQLRLKL